MSQSLFLKETMYNFIAAISDLNMHPSQMETNASTWAIMTAQVMSLCRICSLMYDWFKSKITADVVFSIEGINLMS